MATTKKDVAVSKTLQELDLNNKAADEEQPEKPKDGCDACGLARATKRCSKRHPKCLKKLFCDEICEQKAHKKAKAPQNPDAASQEQLDPDKAKAAKAKMKKAKKAAVAKNKEKNGEFWWNNSVYASW